MVELIKTGGGNIVEVFGIRGRTYSKQGIIEGKVVIYYELDTPFKWETLPILCNIEEIEVLGRIRQGN